MPNKRARNRLSKTAGTSNVSIGASGIGSKLVLGTIVFLLTYRLFDGLENNHWQLFHVQSSSSQVPTTRATSSSNNSSSCMAKARQHNVAFLKENLERFWGKENYMQVLLERLGKEVSLTKDWNVFIDVGAGSYAEAGGDVSLSLFFDQLFPAPQKTIVAFEPFQEAHDNLLHEYQRYLSQHNHRQNLLNFTLFQKGCGMVDDDGSVLFRGTKNIMTANKRIALHPAYSGKETRKIPSTSIHALNLPHIHILKTDTEGLEWEVLLGARQLIKQHAIDLIFFAYEDKWTFDSFTAAYPVQGSMIKEQQMELDTPNLKSVSTWLESLGYVTYLIGLAPQGQQGFVAIPVSGDYWDDSFEVARDPKSYGYHYTWMDAMAVQKKSSLQAWIEQQSQSHAMMCSQEE